jgi:hypothetical protein
MDKEQHETPDNDTLGDIQAFSLNLIPLEGDAKNAEVEIKCNNVLLSQNSKMHCLDV